MTGQHHTRWSNRLLPVVVLLSLAVRADAQSSVARSADRRLSLLVIDEADRPVPAARVELVNGSLRLNTATDSLGTVRFSNLVDDSVTISVRRLGYRPTRILARLAELEEKVTVFLDQQPDLLSAVEVRERAPSVTRLADFESRLRSRSASAVVTRQQIDQRNPIRLSQMLRGISGLRLADSLGSLVAISNRGMKSVPSPEGIAWVPCVLRVVLDGIILPAGADIDQVVPQDVHGVEVFFGAASIPSSLGGLRTDSWCGLIAIWTRSGEPRRRPLQ